MGIAQEVSAVHITHDVFQRCKRHINMRGIVHRQDDTGDDLQHQAERQNDAPDPPPVQVLGGRDHQRIIGQADNRQARVQPFFEPCLGFIVVVGNTSHFVSLP